MGLSCLMINLRSCDFMVRLAGAERSKLLERFSGCHWDLTITSCSKAGHVAEV